MMELSIVEGSQLLSARQMERFGLVRVWYNQLAVNERVAKLRSVVVEGDTLFAVSSDAKLHAISTATGKLLWSRVMGKRELQYREPAANSRVVAVVNNIELFIFDRKTGKMLFYVPLPNSVSVTACEISENYVYIPMLGGRIIVYPLEEGVAEKTFNAKTGEYEETIPSVIKPPSSANKTEQSAADKAKDKALSMKALVDGDLDKRDEVVAEITESFARTKYSILAKPDVPPKELQFVLRPPLSIPMSTISFGDLTIQPKLSTQILKADSTNPNNDKAVLHWEILTWINKDGDFHASVIRDLSKEKIDQLYKISSPTKAFRPEINQIAERDWNIGKQVVIRPATNQTVPYFYSATNVDDQFIQDLSVIGTKSGYVYAIKNRSGEVAWHFVANGSVVEQIAVIGVDVFVPTLNGLHKIDVRRGKDKWFVPNIVKFICASRSRVYVQDKNGFLVILDRKSGGRIASLDLRRFREVLFNVETDRLFIIDEAGLIQCFAERQADTPSNNLRLGTRSVPETRHRLSAAQYVEVMRGGNIPDLYWVESLGISGKTLEEIPVKTEELTAKQDDVPVKTDNEPVKTDDVPANTDDEPVKTDDPVTENPVEETPTTTETETPETPESPETPPEIQPESPTEDPPESPAEPPEEEPEPITTI
jgi:hypothetical protein